MRTMFKIRRFEEKIIELYPKQQMKTPVHLCLGQEAIAAGVCANLKKSDYIFSNHRNHGHCIAKGMDLKYIMAELYGKKTGCSGGKGGSMHLVDIENGILGTTAIVGGAIPIATGSALGSQLKRDKKVTVVFFGDGAVDTGVFSESLNFAALKKLPIVFVCENNFYATNSHILARQVADNIYQRSKPYLIPSIRTDGNDVLRIYKTAKKAIERARAGRGPTLLEYRTYRLKQHVGPSCDHETGCRPKAELFKWIERCPISKLVKGKVVSQSDIDRIAVKIDKEIEGALRFAKRSAFPKKQELLEDVY